MMSPDIVCQKCGTIVNSNQRTKAKTLCDNCLKIKMQTRARNRYRVKNGLKPDEI